MVASKGDVENAESDASHAAHQTMEETVAALSPQRKRILNFCKYRGMHETELVLGDFALKHLPRMGDADLLDFERLLMQLDVDLYQWATGAQQPPENLDTPVMAWLKAHVDDMRAAAKRGAHTM